MSETEQKANTDILRLERWLADHCDKWDTAAFARKQAELDDARLVARIIRTNWAA